jgi:hypothetical protein
VTSNKYLYRKHLPLEKGIVAVLERLADIYHYQRLPHGEPVPFIRPFEAVGIQWPSDSGESKSPKI